MKTRYNSHPACQGKNLHLWFSLMLICLSILPAYPQLAEWSFENISSAVPSLPIAASYKIPQISASANLSGGNNNGSPDVCSGAETWSTNFWPTTGNRSTGDYLEFSIRTDPGETVEISYFSFSSSASSTNSALDFEVYYSKNSFTTSTFLFSGSHTIGGCSGHGAGLYVTLLPGVTIKFRIYLYGQNVAAQAATIRIDDVSIYGGILPVTLTAFSGVGQKDQVLLKWSTATELNNNYFGVERSADELKFTEIGRVYGLGDSQTEQKYQFQDTHPFAGINYYRLKQVDFDGTYSYHPIIAVAMDQRADVSGQIRLYPNVARTNIRIALGFKLKKSVPYAIYSLFGQQIKNGTIHPQKTIFTLPVQDLPPGPYIFSTMANDQHLTARFVKQ